MRSELTVKNYYTDIKLFLRFLKKENNLSNGEEFENIHIADVPEEVVKNTTLNDLLSFLSYVSTERDNKGKARARKAVALRQFFKYLTVKKLWFEVSPAQNLELPPGGCCRWANGSKNPAADTSRCGRGRRPPRPPSKAGS